MGYGLIGEHLKHSFSKDIHEFIADYRYEIKELAPKELEAFILNKNYKAINVTIPYKEKVIPYLDDISSEAKEVGAVNTIVNKNGKLYGFNTDVYGFIALVKKINVNFEKQNVLILGNGGASKAVKAASKMLKANKIYIASVNNEDNTVSYQDIYQLDKVDIIVNTTPVGMYPNEQQDLIIDLDRFPDLKGVIDVVYNPIRTRLVLEAQKRNIPSSGGLYMLVAQAYNAIEIFLDKNLDKSLLEKAYKMILLKKTNIVLIGMPSSGKSVIAKKLKDRLNLKILDMDNEIVSHMKMPITDIFASFGEAKFRELEHQVIIDNHQYTPLIISTGGGVIKRADNIDLLKHNGVLFFINRDIKKLVATSDRPLSNNRNDLEKLYEERLPLYRKYMDVEVDNNGDIEDTVNTIMLGVGYEDFCH